MKLFFLKAWREIKRKKTRSIPIVIVVMVSGIGIIMFGNINFSWKAHIHEMWEGHNYHHLLVTTNPTAPSNMTQWVNETIQKTGISPKYEIRAFFEAEISLKENFPNKNYSTHVIAVNTSRELEVDQLFYYNDITLHETSEAQPMVINKASAAINGWNINAEFILSSEFGSINLTNIGFVESPEYIATPGIVSEFMGMWTDSVVWIDYEDLIKTTNMQSNQITFYFDNSGEKNTFLNHLLDVIDLKNILFIEGRNSYFEMFQPMFFTLWLLVAIVFTAASVIMVYIVINRSIEEDRPTLGLFIAMGFNDREIVSSSIFYSLILCLIGEILGSITGIIIGIQIVSDIFSSDTRVIPTTSSFSPWTLFIVLGYFFITTMIILIDSVLACRKILKLSPMESIRPSVNLKPGKKVLIEQLSEILRIPLSPLTRFSLRSVFRKKRKALFAIIGIVLATSVTLLGSVMYIGYRSNLGREYSEYQQWDVQIFFQPNTNFNSSNILALLQEYNINDIIDISEPFVTAPIRFEDDMSRLYLLTGIPEKNLLRKFAGGESPRSQEFYITRDFANRFDIDKGSSVNVIDLTGKINSIKIGRVLNEMSNNGIFSSIATARYLANVQNNEYINGLFLKTNEPYEVNASLALNPDIKEIVVKQELINMVEEYSNEEIVSFSLSFLIGLTTGMAISIVTVSISISERKHDFINFRALGISNTEIFRNVFLEIFIIGIGGILLGLATGMWFLNLIFDWISTFGATYYTSFDLVTLSIPVINVILGMTIATHISLRSLFKTSISESTVSRMIG